MEHRDLSVILSFLTGTSRILQRRTRARSIVIFYSHALWPPSKRALMLFLHLALMQTELDTQTQGGKQLESHSLLFLMFAKPVV